MLTNPKPEVENKAKYNMEAYEIRERALRILKEQDPEDWDNRLLPYIGIRAYTVADIRIDYSRNALLTEKGLETLVQRYLAEGETDPQHVFARVAVAGSNDLEHAQRLYDYISKLYFMPATPVLTNLGTDRGLPISCFLQEVEDSMKSILNHYKEAAWMGCRGGGIGTYWGNLRGIGEKVGDVGETSGIVPFVRVSDSITQAVSQGGVRRGVAAGYLPINHPEIIEFTEIRKPSGDINRKALNIHHGVLITDEFMEAVRDGAMFALRSPKDNHIVEEVDARGLFQRLVETRLATGEPYMVFIDHVNRVLPKAHRKLDLKVTTSNLCSEITLPTGKDHVGRSRSAVCCLSSLNLLLWDEYKDNFQFFLDVYYFLDNVLEDFITRAPGELEQAVYSAWRERSVGLGVMGWHSLLQSRMIPWESATAKGLNINIFKRFHEMAEKANVVITEDRGSCPDAIDAGICSRFTYKSAIAPTASISIIAGGVSACIEPIPANVYVSVTISGNHIIKNPYLQTILQDLGKDTDDVWISISEKDGSVQHLDYLTQDQKDIFKTAMELDQRWLLEQQADRTPYIDQAISFNLFIPPTIDKWDLLMLHYRAWELKIKSLYYLRSESSQKAGFGEIRMDGLGDVSADNTMDHAKIIIPSTAYDECLACT